MRAPRRRSGRPRAAALVGALVLGALGCRRIDPGDRDEDGISNAQARFDADVQPILVAKCGSSDCHGPGDARTPTRFVDGDPATAYFTAVNFSALTGPFTPAHAPVLTRVAAADHRDTVGYTDDELLAIVGWLLLEVSSRYRVTAEESAAFSTSIDLALARYRGCMTLEDYVATNMDAWATTTTDVGTCRSCHLGAGGGFLATTGMFEVLRTRRDLFLQYFTIDVFQSPEPTISPNFVAFDRVARREDPHRDHPAFDPFDTAGMTALLAWDSDIENRMLAGTCAAEPFPAPPLQAAPR